MNGRKAQTEPLLPYLMIIISGIVFGALLTVIVMQSNVLEFRGETQSSLMNVVEMNERSFTYMDALSSQSLRRAANELGKTGGYYFQNFEEERLETECGISTYPIWISPEKNCYPNVSENIAERGETAFISRLDRYDEVALDNSEFEFTPVSSENSYAFQIQSTDDIRIPIHSSIANYYQRESETEETTSLGYQNLDGYRHGSRGDANIDSVVIHWTGGGSLESAENALQGTSNSYHYIIDKEGEIHQLVPEHRRANHAGCAGKDHRCESFNSNSIGISIVSCGYDREGCDIPERRCLDYSPQESDKNNCRLGNPEQCREGSSETYTERCYDVFTQKQLNAAAQLLSDIDSRYPNFQISQETVLGHDQIEEQKVDPGPAFDYEYVIGRANQEETIK